jgi:hypothetical protein
MLEISDYARYVRLRVAATLLLDALDTPTVFAMFLLDVFESV